MPDVTFDVLELDAPETAKRLLGAEVVRTYPDGVKARARIVETEYYTQTDVASHSFKGKTARTEVMFGPAGRLYVYFTYGLHFCANVVIGKDGHGAAVLIRAVESLEGTEKLSESRGYGEHDIRLTNGPAKFCQAFDIDRRLNGHDLTQKPLQLNLRPMVDQELITTAVRIGISQAKEKPWRFYLTDNPYVSKR